MNNDELQKAIDDITRDTTSVAPAEAAPADNEVLANEIAGNPAPQPAGVPGQGLDIPAAPAPVVPEAPAMPPVMQEMVAAAVPQPAPVVPEPVTVQPAASTVTGEADLDSVAREARRELYPLLEHVQMSPEEKFEICMEVSADDRNAFEGALMAAKQITDDTAKAEALLRIISATK